MSDNPLVVLNNNEELVQTQKVNALSRLFQVKPATLELVSKASRQSGAQAGKLRVVQTNEHFDSMRAVILFEPTERRKKYTKGNYSKDALECFSTTNVQPHPSAKNPPALYCASCPSGDIGWIKYREAKSKGVSGDALSALVPPCKKYWNLLIVDRATKLPYFLNVGGTSVKPFEVSMQSMARLFQLMIAQAKTEIKAGKAVKLPNSVQDIIWQISFTLGVDQPIKGGQYVFSFTDFKVLNDEDKLEFGAMYQDFVQRRSQGNIQSQDAAEAEAETAMVTEAPSNAVAEANKQITI